MGPEILRERFDNGPDDPVELIELRAFAARFESRRPNIAGLIDQREIP
ncbi:hypothetical protein [Arthrobacter zhaoguopingii]|nr:hypothetical protein [Arthrobacter zhaoguopingii]